ncbi:MAG: methyltransferase domain-containing protein [Rhodospirillales bacterium]|nr:methyltransferase domain-containing protein [Rhodospirillales bacterium]
MGSEREVTQHYGDSGLITRIFAGLEAAGADLNNLTPEDLSPVDEFHLGGRKATIHAVSKLPLNKDSHVLDIGCGIGGTARFIASETGCRVTGIDLTPEYISTAQILNSRTGLADQVTCEIANALNMPFDEATFDVATTFHVAMNISERGKLYSEIARVLKPGGVFCLYDIMKKGDEPIDFPVPWAHSAATSHLTTPDEMLVHLEAAGFEVEEVEDRTNFALEVIKQGLAARTEGPPPLGVHLLMGAGAPEKVKNTRNNVQAGRMAPVQMIARRVG